MEAAEFESLSKKVEHAVSLIEALKQERDGLKAELLSVRERAESLHNELSVKTGELEHLQLELNRKSENISLAGEHVRDLVSRLEAALA
jgi:uncharacterized coiled-coil DUF342 family protein